MSSLSTTQQNDDTKQLELEEENEKKDNCQYCDCENCCLSSESELDEESEEDHKVVRVKKI